MKGDNKRIQQMEINSLTQRLNEITKRKVRVDKGKERAKYDSSLPANYRAYLMRSNKKQFEFEFTVEEFNEIVTKNCTYCDEPEAGGIDRVDSKQGYKKNNSVPCCWKCNAMKFTLSLKEFTNHIKKVFNHISQ